MKKLLYTFIGASLMLLGHHFMRGFSGNLIPIGCYSRVRIL